MNETEREQFDSLLEQAIEQLPDSERLFKDMPLIVDDFPDEEFIESIESEERIDEMCGCFLQYPLMKKSWLQPYRPWTPCKMLLFRDAIVRKAGGWGADGSDERVGGVILETFRDLIEERFKKREDKRRHDAPGGQWKLYFY